MKEVAKGIEIRVDVIRLSPRQIKCGQNRSVFLFITKGRKRRNREGREKAKHSQIKKKSCA